MAVIVIAHVTVGHVGSCKWCWIFVSDDTRRQVTLSVSFCRFEWSLQFFRSLFGREKSRFSTNCHHASGKAVATGRVTHAWMGGNERQHRLSSAVSQGYSTHQNRHSIRRKESSKSFVHSSTMSEQRSNCRPPAAGPPCRDEPARNETYHDSQPLADRLDRPLPLWLHFGGRKECHTVHTLAYILNTDRRQHKVGFPAKIGNRLAHRRR